MKHHAVELPSSRSYGLPKASQIILLVIFVTLVFPTVISVLYPLLGYPLYLLQSSFSSNSSSAYENIPQQQEQADSIKISDQAEAESICDLSSGEWVPNPDAPYYTNTTCSAIHEHQNCMKYGRPDTEFMKWKWKPYGCELPAFHPAQFLEIVRGKSLAFVGDSVARNQMQSLICLLSRVESPVDVSLSHAPYEKSKRWKYITYNFTIANFWAPYLVKSKEREAPQTGLFDLYLDEFDETWTTQIDEFDYLIISGGHWFSRRTVFYENHQIVGCRYCMMQNVTELTKFYGYRKAIGTAFKAINNLENFKGITILRTFAPSHFENGWWSNGGNCVRTKPYRSNETTLDGDSLELYMIQMEEFKAAEREGRRKGKEYRLLDMTQAMLLRPDGHPSRYGHWARPNETTFNDCLHWCLPGPIDSWNDILLQMLKMEGTRSHQEKLHSQDRIIRLH